ncbi:NUDIX domain-containing protein [Novosphingobium mangrovi (ex Huang et al. 2023)]|uniref:NUDIX domain-containing protein n=1 Tax=Novosphingobium mangrovi (ex Huang et al. 2023) TaxID=2976432 RepID=A0ABT2I236_9SPHN|nr:NUDIX domain-containing protein [Novosphingobium mangrovi (ex Huang et al. 2023)]MCT2398870.1 NUDIX domain-containing protein [Novosphingobium mangrovi (ex Huang et al. 2023)]
MPLTTPSDQPMPADAPSVVPAATVVIFRRPRSGEAPELLMVQRAHEMRFAGGAAVFPGGRVDPADRDLARRLLPDEAEEIAAARIAAIRETLEETGLVIATRAPVSASDAAAARRMLIETGELAPVLDHFGWELVPERLTFYAHWCPLWDKAFDTRFFVTDLGTGAVDVAVDETENTHLFWTSAAGALEMADRGEISVIFPTRRNLERLAQYASFAEALAEIAAHPVSRIHPGTEHRADGEWLVIPDGHGYPVLGQPKATARRG